jgi:integrase
MKGPGWKRKPLDSPEWDYYEEKILGIKDPLAQALCTVLYLTGARRNEVLPVWRYDYIKKTKVAVPDTGLFKHQLRAQSDGTLLFVNMRVEKRRPDKAIKRNVPTSTRDQKLIDVVKSWIAPLSNDALVFDIKTSSGDPTTRPDAHAYLLIKKHTGWNPHQFRHFCMSVRYVRDEFRESHLQKFAGWSSTSPAQHYTHLGVKDLKKLLEERK